MAVAIAQSRKLGLGTKLAYGFGSIAYGIKDNGFSTLLLLFYNQVIGLRADLVGLAIMVALVLDAFIDPVVGHLSDHSQSRWGRRHPFMYAAALPVGVLYLLLWSPPMGSQTETLVYLIGVAILVRTAISIYEVPSAALAPELTADYHERTSVLGWRYLFGWLGGMGMLLLTFAVILAPTPEYLGRSAQPGRLSPVRHRRCLRDDARDLDFRARHPPRDSQPAAGRPEEADIQPDLHRHRPHASPQALPGPARGGRVRLYSARTELRAGDLPQYLFLAAARRGAGPIYPGHHRRRRARLRGGAMGLAALGQAPHRDRRIHRLSDIVGLAIYSAIARRVSGQRITAADAVPDELLPALDRDRGGGHYIGRLNGR